MIVFGFEAIARVIEPTPAIHDQLVLVSSGRKGGQRRLPHSARVSGEIGLFRIPVVEVAGKRNLLRRIVVIPEDQTAVFDARSVEIALFTRMRFASGFSDCALRVQRAVPLMTERQSRRAVRRGNQDIFDYSGSQFRIGFKHLRNDRRDNRRGKRSSIHVLVMWRDEAKLVDAFVLHLAARRSGEADRDEPTGLLTHHAAHDEACWAFVEALFRRLAAHAAVRWLAAPRVFADGAAL